MTRRCGDSRSSGSRMPRAAPPAPSTSTSRPAIVAPTLWTRSRNNPAPSVLSPYQWSPAPRERVARPRRCRTVAVLPRQCEGFQLERNRDVEPLAALADEPLDGSDEAVARCKQPLVGQGWSGGLRERGLDDRRLAVGDRIADRRRNDRSASLTPRPPCAHHAGRITRASAALNRAASALGSRLRPRRSFAGK